MPPTKAGGRSTTSSARQPSHQSWLSLFAAAGRQAVIRLFQNEDFTYASSIAYYASSRCFLSYCLPPPWFDVLPTRSLSVPL